ncbi:MAG: hypothetical protein RLZZ555_1728, partial [Pseudomonadota bacterium]
DLFVFSDKDRRYSSWARIRTDFARNRRPLEMIASGPDFVQFRSGRKTGLLLWEDNNLVLERLRRAELQVHHFVGICDGCCEGGNYECVHERPFVRRLMRVAADGMRYTTDHSRPLQGFDPYSGRGMFHARKFHEHLSLDQFPDPEHWTRPGPVPEVEHLLVPHAVFELQGVLVGPDEHGARHRLAVLPKGRMEATELEKLKPFRTLANRGILAEYRVSLQRDQVELDWSQP